MQTFAIVLSAYSIRISTNVCDCFTLRALDITTGAEVRNIQHACETELRKFYYSRIREYKDYRKAMNTDDHQITLSTH